MNVLCFDVGGTSIKYALINDNTDIEKVEVLSMPTRKTKDSNYILEDIINKISEFSNIDAIGISTAGVVDSEKGCIVYAGPTIPGYTNCQLKKEIEEKYGIKVFVENDVNSAAYGIYKHEKYVDDICVLTIGTGVGGAIIINNEIYKGKSNTAGEIGYMPLKGKAFQDLSSTTYITETVSEKIGKKVDGIYVFEEAKKGNKICIDVLEEFIDNLTSGLVNIVYLLNPGAIVLGGGISAQKEYLEEKIRNSLKEKLVSEKFMVDLKLANISNLAGIYGIYNLTKRGFEK